MTDAIHERLDGVIINDLKRQNESALRHMLHDENCKGIYHLVARELMNKERFQHLDLLTLIDIALKVEAYRVDAIKRIHDEHLVHNSNSLKRHSIKNRIVKILNFLQTDVLLEVAESSPRLLVPIIRIIISRQCEHPELNREQYSKLERFSPRIAAKIKRRWGKTLDLA